MFLILKKNKGLLAILCSFFLIFSLYFYSKKSSPIDFDYLHVDCSIYSSDGKLIFKGPIVFDCDYHENGSIIVSDNYLKDKNGNTVWGNLDNTHHVVSFSKDRTSVNLIGSELIKYNNQMVKSDCFVKRKLNGELIARWCLKDHIEELKQLGFSFELQKVGLRSQTLQYEFEISHGNTFFEIPENKYSNTHLGFKKGNYLLNVGGSRGCVLILNHELTQVLWSYSLHNFKVPEIFIKNSEEPLANAKYRFVAIHDSQVEEAGTILSYVTMSENNTYDNLPDYLSFINKKGFKNRTFVVRWDPLNVTKNYQVIWRAPHSKPSDIPIAGKARKLRNGNYLISESTIEGSRAFVINSNGEEVWNFQIANENNQKKEWFNGVEPFYNVDFLKSRGLIED